jgi:ABC-type multidrug transport system fused ATPase/permease subunit
VASRKGLYAERLQAYMGEHAECERQFNAIAFMRLLTVLGGGIVAFAAAAANVAVGAAILVVAGFVFYRLTIRHEAVFQARRLASGMSEVNASEIERADRSAQNLPHGGSFRVEDHCCADDLDLLGARSVFEYINRGTTSLGRKRLASWLLNAATVDTIRDRQQIVADLEEHLDWRQKLQALGLELHDSDRDPDVVEDWRAESDMHDVTLPPKLLLIVLPVITALSLVAAIVTPALDKPPFVVPAFIPLVFIIVQRAMLHPTREQVHACHGAAQRLGMVLDKYMILLRCVEDETFSSAPMQALQQRLSHDGQSASEHIAELDGIINQLDVRHNAMIHVPVNTLFLWDLHVMRALVDWRRSYAGEVGDWLDVVAECEALASLATLKFNHPSWCMPTVDEDAEAMIAATRIGHPLLPPATRIDNDVTIHRNETVVITGSNMAGKSTFMRSVGVAVVMAQAGAPVCARSFSLSPCTVWSSMRTRDSLADNESTFYAELKRLKLILDAVTSDEPTLFILDEVLRGTNSRDRHLGAAALLCQLVESSGSGMMATHDLELARLCGQYGDAVTTVCFESQLENDQLSFDYTMKSGVCQNLNASYLMNQMGIHVPDEDTPGDAG